MDIILCDLHAAPGIFKLDQAIHTLKKLRHCRGDLLKILRKGQGLKAVGTQTNRSRAAPSSGNNRVEMTTSKEKILFSSNSSPQYALSPSRFRCLLRNRIHRS